VVSGCSFCPTGGPTGTDSHFSPASYIIRNFGKPITVLATCSHAGFLVRFFFDPEDGGDILIGNVD
jgi:hypothetical protein